MRSLTCVVVAAGMAASSASGQDGTEVVRRICETAPPSEARKAHVQQRLQLMRRMGPQLSPESPARCPVWIHVIHRENGEGRVPCTVLDQQISVLNADFGPHGIRFVVKGIEFVASDEWFRMRLGTSNTIEAKTELARDPNENLNLYTAAPGGGVLGFASWPWDCAEKPKLDGVVIDYRTLPGGDFENYNLGRTATHEVGHWLGLYHTFEGGCSDPGDHVQDTPAEKEPVDGCPEDGDVDSCPERPGRDSVNNYMNYAYDRCMVEFTRGQVARMVAMMADYRTALLPDLAMRNLKLGALSSEESEVGAFALAPVGAGEAAFGLVEALGQADMLLQREGLEWGVPTGMLYRDAEYVISFETGKEEEAKLGTRRIVVERGGRPGRFSARFVPRR